MKIKLPKKLFVTGIGTEVGKTVVSAILVEALKANYWKPIQAGSLDDTDTMRVQSWVSHSDAHFYKESYRLKQPMSPHASARIDGIEIGLEQIQIPKSEVPLVIEGAGGLMVPLNEKLLIIDLIQALKVPVILVSRNYLGSINHTLLSIESLKTRGIEIAGVVFNGLPNAETEKYILNYSGLPCVGYVREEAQITRDVVLRYAQQWRQNFEAD